jgi:hypothetical protein
VRIEFHRPNEPDDVVGSATWDGGRARVEADEDVRSVLERIFRATPVVTDDAAYRRQGARGEVVLQPGSLAWFSAAAYERAREAGLVARTVPGVREGGWDPAAQYRTFRESIDRLEHPSEWDAAPSTDGSGPGPS